MFQSPSMEQGFSMGTSGGQCNERKHDTPSDFVSESQTLAFFTQVELDNSVVNEEGGEEKQEEASKA